MKQLTKLILIALHLSLSAFGAEEPGTPQADKPALSITAFTLKSSDGRLEMKMDDKGRILVNGKHVATANAKGEFNTPEGKQLLRIKGNGELESDRGHSGVSQGGRASRRNKWGTFDQFSQKVAPWLSATINP